MKHIHSATTPPAPKPVLGTRLDALQAGLSPGWSVVKRRRLERDFEFEDFRSALAFTNLVGELAEQQKHHPDIRLSWGKVKLTLTTHDVHGLSEKDFVFAAHVDEIRKIDPAALSAFAPSTSDMSLASGAPRALRKTIRHH